MLKTRALNWVVCGLATAVPAAMLLLADVPGSNTARWVDVNLLLMVFSLGQWILFISVRAYPAATGLHGYALLLSGLMTAAIWWSHTSLLSYFTDIHGGYYRWASHTKWIRLLLTFPAMAWPALTMAQTRRIALQEEKLRQQSDASALLREAELFRLRQQLQPHFLFNSLNAVSSLILVAPEKAVDTIGRLSGFLRTSVRRDGQALVPLAEELDYIRTYLQIESVRFGDRLHVSVPDEVPGDAVIPPAILQPLLENAVKFGIYGVTGAVEILLEAELTGNELGLRISNPFDPSGTRKPGTGFGLEGVRRRLYLLYGRTDLLRTEAENNFFTVHLQIPQPRV